MHTVERRLAAQLDRLALCVHKPAGEAPQWRATASRLGLQPHSILVGAARQIAAGRVTLLDLELLSRYASRTLVRRNAEREVELGFYHQDGDALVPRDDVRAAARLVLELQAEAAERIWAGSELTPHLTDADRIVAAADGYADERPCFARMVALHSVVPDAPASRLLARLTELRYLRADLHALALGRRGLAGPRAHTVDRLWRDLPITDEEGAALEDRGLATRTRDRWVLTPDVAATREDAELETDTLTTAALSGSGVDLEQLTSALEALAGDARVDAAPR